MIRDHERLTELFARAAALRPAARQAFLSRACADDLELRAEIESLLREEQDLPTILREGVLFEQLQNGSIAVPDRVGPYHVIKRLGEGGMGVVCLAEQRDPIRRLVAVKLIKKGLETEEILERFASEQRVLAMMTHPNIARVLDAGATEENLPYFAMEYVDGEPITRYCDLRRLDVTGRLRLFLQACDAVQHAHQNAIIHRDIKPSNILVATAGNRPVLKVIDFGVAKALAPDAAGKGLTRIGQFVGTPGYMSPEQARLTQNIDTRSDIYSLGALLYELLAGTPPFDPGPDLEQSLQRVVDDEPPRPSALLAAAGVSGEGIAACRQASPSSLARRCRGDLDCITMKALEKDRSRRYGSASELAADVRRHLDGEPIEARSRSTLYRLGRYIRKHRTVAAAVAVAVPLLLGFGVVMGVQARRIASERDRAEEVAELLVGFYEVPFFVSGRHRPAKLEDVLRHSTGKVGQALNDRPLLRARLMHSLGKMWQGIGNAEAARPLLDTACASLERLLGAEHPRTLAAMSDCAQVLTDLERNDEAERLFRQILEEQRRVLGDEDPDTLRTMSALGVLLKKVGNNDDGAAMFEAAHDGLRRTLGDEHRETLIAASLLASVYLDLHRFEQARGLLLETLPRMKDDEPEKRMAFYNLGCVYARLGERDSALEHLRQAVAGGFSISFWGDPHLASLRQDEEFVDLARSARVQEPFVRDNIKSRVESYVRDGRLDEAEALWAYVKQHLPPGQADVIDLVSTYLVDIHLRQEKYEEVERLIREILKRRQDLHGRDFWVLAYYRWPLVQAHLGRGDTQAALSELDASMAIYEESDALNFLAYTRACRAALTGDRRLAIEQLREAADRGFFLVDWLRRDRALATLRDLPEFEEIVESVSRRHEFL